MPKRVFVCLIAWLLAFLSEALSFYAEVGSEVYRHLRYLEATGCIRSGLLGTLPLSQKEVTRLIREAEGCRGAEPLVKRLKELVKYEPDQDFVKPAEEVVFEALYADFFRTDRAFYNEDGVEYFEGLNGRTSVRFLVSYGKLKFAAEPEFLYNPRYERVGFRRIYLRYARWNLDFSYGKESLWWGPGLYGSIILSNNAEPLPMFRVSNEVPTILPSVLKVLGPFRFTFFVTRLDEDRVVPNPWMWGARMNFKPHPLVEVGLSRTALLGGEGRSADLGTWIDSFLARGENVEFPGQEEPGDQRAGFDIKILSPWKALPASLYFEAEGEDEAGGLPSRWAYLAGVFLPLTFTGKNAALTLEYARTTVHWYIHHIYKSGYTYEGRILGHHIGRDAYGLFVSLDYYFYDLKKGVKVGYSEVKHELTSEREEVFWVSGFWEVGGKRVEVYGGWVNTDGEDGPFVRIRFKFLF